MDVAHDVPLHVLEGEGNEDDREHSGQHRDHHLHTHNEVESHHATGDDQRGHDEQRHHLSEVAPVPAEAGKDGGRREHRNHREGGLPPYAEQPRDRRGQAVPAHAVGRSRENHCRRGSLLAGDRDQATEPETEEDTDRPHDDRLDERDAKAQDVRAVAQAQDGDVRSEPRPEEFARRALALGLGDEIDTVRFDAQRVRWLGVDDLGHVWLPPRAPSRRVASIVRGVRTPLTPSARRRRVRWWRRPDCSAWTPS